MQNDTDASLLKDATFRQQAATAIEVRRSTVVAGGPIAFNWI
jgi:hypothetical protein